ncbi:MAG: acyltransferase [Acidobacteria bacterium]|nr:acyltransferase [Acidobacteriota bacterium]
MILKKLYHQWYFHRSLDHPASRIASLHLAWRSDAYVSPRASVYYPGRVVLGRGAEIHDYAMLNYRSGPGGAAPNLFIGENTKIMPHAKLVPQQGWIRIGRNCSIQYGCLLYGVGGLEIGDDSRIAAYTIMTPMNHVFADPRAPIRTQGETAEGIRIGRDVWIGAGVRIVDGVIIGDGCVVGAGSVVTKSLPPFSVAVGVPARVLYSREGGPPTGTGAAAPATGPLDAR